MSQTIDRILIDCSHLFATNEKRGIDRVLSQIVGLADTWTSTPEIEVLPVAWLPDGRFHHITTDSKYRGASPRVVRGLRKLNRYFVPYVLVLLYKKMVRTIAGLYYVRRFKPVGFKAGDVLLIADANWNLPSEYLQALTPLKSMSTKIVLMVYDLIPLKFPQYVDKRLAHDFNSWFGSVMELSDAALAISKTIASDLEDYAKTNHINGLGIKVTYLGADYHHSIGGKVEPGMVGFFGMGRPYLVVGALESRKQQDLVFRAFQRLWAAGVNCKVCFVGKVLPSAYDLLDNMRLAPQWGSQLYVFQNTSDDELAFCYANSKALIAASAAEGFDLPVVEARSHSLTVLASDTPVHREVGQGGLTYFNITTPKALTDLIIKLEKDPNSFVAQGFNWMGWQESVFNILQSVVEVTKS